MPLMTPVRPQQCLVVTGLIGIRGLSDKMEQLVKETECLCTLHLSRTRVHEINKHFRGGRRAAHCALNSSH